MSKLSLVVFCTVLSVGVSLVVAEERPDILVADFEGADYGSWTPEGEAFGAAPVREAFSGQMHVIGFTGKQFVNSARGGDAATGKLVSPEFTIQRNTLFFQIGGGEFPESLYLALYVEGKEIARLSGRNREGAKLNNLAWRRWDVKKFIGKKARLEIVDDCTEKWGHILIDQIVQTDRTKIFVRREKSFLIEKRFLHLPVQWGNPMNWMQVHVDGEWKQEFVIELADDRPDYNVTLEVGQWKGKNVTLVAEEVFDWNRGLDRVTQSDEMADAVTDDVSVYTEKYRPQYHFSARRGWLNDPNGLLYYDGEYHLFFQSNPFSARGANKSWGHAVSTDLLHWTELPAALLPDRMGTIFSGGGAVDFDNSSGFQTGKEKPLILAYTSAGGTNRFKDVPFTQSIAYSNDRGRSWTKYEGNPVLPHIEGTNRDPKIFWHPPTKRWIMALYLDRQDYMLFGSKDLKNWEKLCLLEKIGCGECPDMFELPVDSDPNNRRWVFWGGNGTYLIGRFDGTTFKPETEPIRSKYGGQDYAAQTFNDMPASDGRRIQISWLAKGEYPYMPFSQQMSIPRELTLRNTPVGIRMYTYPVAEVETLRGEPAVHRKIELKDGNPVTIGVPGELYDLDMQLVVGTADRIEATFRGQKYVYLVKDGRMAFYDPVLGKTKESFPAATIDGRLELRLLLDRMSLEMFVNRGVIHQARCYVPTREIEEKAEVVFKAVGGDAAVESLNIWPLRSVWKTGK